jgi:hypothetical protein
MPQALHWDKIEVGWFRDNIEPFWLAKWLQHWLRGFSLQLQVVFGRAALLASRFIPNLCLL